MAELVEGGTKRCYVKIEPLKELGSHYINLSVETNVRSRRMSRDEKILTLPKKKTQSRVKRNAVKTGRVSKKAKGKKFQVKITQFLGSSNHHNDRASPVDSGFSSRPETPEEEGDESDVENSKIDENVKDDFLNSLDDEDVASDLEEDGDSDWEDNKAVIWKPKKPTKRISQASNVLVIPKTEKSEYEKKRDKSIKDAEALMQALKAQWASFKTKTAPKPRPSIVRTPRVKEEFTGELRRSGRKTGERVQYTVDDEIPRCRAASIKREFDENGRYIQRAKPRVSRSDINPNINVLMPEDVTESMLNKIHMSGGGKIYNTQTGTCCHQCRQKTTDTKTVCRSGVCTGLRGQFCGSCLNNRYGESVRESLKDPEWQCPPCRGICNCSFCLEAPTGQLIHLARARGFKSVHHYLQHLRAKWDDEVCD